MFYYNDDRYRYVMEYPDVIPALEVVFKGFGKERIDAKRALAIAMFTAMRREGIYVIPYEALVAVGIEPKTFYKMNEKYPLFTCVNDYYSYKDGVAKEWIPTEEYSKVMHTLLDQESIRSRFLMASFGMKVVHPKSNKYISTDEPMYDYRHTLNLDTDRIRAKMKQSSGEEYNQYSMIFLHCTMQEGEAYQYYQRKNCGRLFGMNKVNIQNIKGEIRDDIFHGYYRIDAANAHWSLLATETEDEAINEYAREPDFYREMIANDLGRTKKEIKKALIMLLYGASKKAIGKDLGENAADSFLNHPFVQLLKKGMVEASKEMIKKYGTVEGKYLQHQVLAHHLMRLESQMLDIAITVADDIQGLYFDGLVSKNPVDTLYLEALIYHTMGVRIRWTQERIGYDEIPA